MLIHFFSFSNPWKVVIVFCQLFLLFDVFSEMKKTDGVAARGGRLMRSSKLH